MRAPAVGPPRAVAVAVTLPRVLVDPAEVEIEATRSQGAGGQNVNKVSSAAHLRFDVHASSLPAAVRERLLALPDRRIGGDGVIVIKAQTHRSLPRNTADALARLQSMVDQAQVVEAARVPTKPTRASRQRRLQGKAQRSGVKAARRRVLSED